MRALQPLKLFGTRRRTQVLLLIAMLEETHASELAKLLGVTVKTVQRIVEGLEDEGLIVGRAIGRERRIRLNERFFGVGELRALLVKLAIRDRETDEAAAAVRRRPRMKNKEADV